MNTSGSKALMALRMTLARSAMSSSSETSRKRGFNAPSASLRSPGSVTQSTPPGIGIAPACQASAIMRMTGCSAEARSACAIVALRRMWPNPCIPCEYAVTRGSDGSRGGSGRGRRRSGLTCGDDRPASERTLISSSSFRTWSSSAGIAGVVDSAWTTSSNAESVGARSEEHTSELQSQSNLVCRLLLEKKKKTKKKSRVVTTNINKINVKDTFMTPEKRVHVEYEHMRNSIADHASGRDRANEN